MGKDKVMSYHWADSTADRVIQIKGDKKKYVVASGITPSGVVHIGNFREMITVDLVARALRDKGKEVRFVYSWDDYDVFRKIPKGWPKEKELEGELRKPIVDVFDPYGKEESFARHNEVAVEKELPKLGMVPEFIYQSEQYRACKYTEGMKKALENASLIKKILDEYRKEPLPEDWLPISIFDPDTGTDNISEIKYLGGTEVSYKDCDGKEKKFDFSKDGRAKLLWRTDWPMRWEYEKVDFEPGGKDHSSPGGSYTTCKEIVKEVYGFDAPFYIMYDFISIKGAGGKISSSLGNVITIKEVLEIYEPAMVRWFFAGTRPNAEFAISFDLDVIKNYEDFDKCERIYYKKEEANEKNYNKQKRIYELSAVNPGKIPKEMPFQPSFRHLTNIIMIMDYNLDKVIGYYKDDIKNDIDKERLLVRYDCAIHWIEKYAPEDFKFNVNDVVPELELSEGVKKVLHHIANLLDKEWNNRDLHNEFYNICQENEVETKDFFKASYQVLISRDKGPQLANFILTLGPKRVKKLFSKV